MKFSKQHILFITLLLFFLVIRFCLNHRIQLWEDHDIAMNLVNEGEFYYDSDGARNHTFQFPIYPYLLAAIYKITGNFIGAAIAFNIFLHVLSAFVLYHLFIRIGRMVFSKFSMSEIHLVSLIAAGLFLFHPALLVYSFFHVHPISLNVLTLFSALFFSLQFAELPNRKNGVQLGLILGLCLLDRATAIFALVPAFLWLLDSGKLKSSFRELFFSVMICFIVILPWLIHNFYTDGIIGFESSAAKNKWKGVLYHSEGGNYLENGENYYSVLRFQEKAALGEMNPIEQRNFFQSKYNEIAMKDPGHVVRMFFLKLKNFWWFRSSAGEEWGEWQSMIFLYKIVFAFVLIGVLLALWFTGIKGWIILSFPLCISFLQAYFYVETRHRIAIEPLLLFFAVVGYYYFFSNKGKVSA